MAKNFNKNLKRANWFLGTFIDEVQFWYICYFGFTVHVCNDEWSTWCLACVVDVIQPWLVSSEKERNTLVLGAGLKELPEMRFEFRFNLIGLLGQFTVMDGSKADGDLVLIQTFVLYYVNQVILMLTSIFQGQFP